MKEEAKGIWITVVWIVAIFVVLGALGIGYRYVSSRADYEINRVSPQRIQSVNEELLRLRSNYNDTADDAGKKVIANQACRVRLSLDRSNVDPVLASWLSEVC